jgi:hypothetical protein
VQATGRFYDLRLRVKYILFVINKAGAQSLLFLLNAACLAQKQIVFGLTRAVLEPTFYYTRGSKHYATDAVLKNICARFVNYKKDVFDSQPQIIKSTSCGVSCVFGEGGYIY